MSSSPITRMLRYQKDAQNVKWYFKGEPTEPLKYSVHDIYQSLLHGFHPQKPRRVAALLLPFETVPAWPDLVENPLQLVYWLCIKCGQPLVQGIARVALVFSAGYALEGPAMGIRWQLGLMGHCCLQEKDYYVGTSPTYPSVYLYDRLESVVEKEMNRLPWKCICSRPTSECSDSLCEQTKALIRKLKQANNADYERQELEERLITFADLLEESKADFVSPFRLERCHNSACSCALPSNKKEGGFLCKKDCRRVIYCSSTCYKKLKEGHAQIGCSIYFSYLESAKLIYLK